MKKLLGLFITLTICLTFFPILSDETVYAAKTSLNSDEEDPGAAN
ncbi:hypothetical protein [Bacillus suaedaesalsae]|nr:hypothetical protein [Bacillus suaedaesalsae]